MEPVRGAAVDTSARLSIHIGNVYVSSAYLILPMQLRFVSCMGTYELRGVGKYTPDYVQLTCT